MIEYNNGECTVAENTDRTVSDLFRGGTIEPFALILAERREFDILSYAITHLYHII